MKHNLNTYLIAVWLTFALSQIASAGVTFDNGLPKTTYPTSSMDVGVGVTVEDFSLSSNTRITDVHFWTQEEIGRSGDGGSTGEWDGTVNWFLFNDNSGSPTSTPFASGEGVNIQKMFLGIVQTGVSPVDIEFYEYWIDLDVPVDLLANTTYWLGLNLGNRGNLSSAWMTTNNIAPFGNGSHHSVDGFNTWTTNSRDLAFYLTGPTVPEPRVSALFGFGLMSLIVLGVARRRRVGI